jgi:hypothetical protein
MSAARQTTLPMLDSAAAARGYDDCGTCGGTGSLFGTGRCRACNGKGYQTANDKRRYAAIVVRESRATEKLWAAGASDPLLPRLRRSEVMLRDALEPSVNWSSAEARAQALTQVIVRRA